MKVIKYGKEHIVVKLKNRRIWIHQSENSMMIVFRALQDERELENKYWDGTKKAAFGKCISEKIVHITNESAKALMQVIALSLHPNMPSITIRPINETN